MINTLSHIDILLDCKQISFFIGRINFSYSIKDIDFCILFMYKSPINNQRIMPSYFVSCDFEQKKGNNLVSEYIYFSRFNLALYH
jgi:hypothetical protein